MKDNLAERLLGIVLGWNDETLSLERPIIDALASLKYDDYQQFKPGFKFLESLALWLDQFIEPEEKIIAYNFIKERLIYVSSAEMNHLVDIAYLTVVEPILLKLAAQESKIPYWCTKKIAESREFRELRRRSLFLGLSDGAKIDRFRRMNKDLSHEQICPSYELSAQKAESLKKKLKEDIRGIRGGASVNDDEATFKIIFLLDDFSASGNSMLRKDCNEYGGKLEKIHRDFFADSTPLSHIIDKKCCDVYAILYIMTAQAKKHIEGFLPEFWAHEKGCCELKYVLQLENEIKVSDNRDKDMMGLIDNYYDHNDFDDHMRVGGTKDGKLGFAACAIPVVLSHNTPNDSIFLLWSYSNKIRGLFPRVTRHKEED